MTGDRSSWETSEANRASRSMRSWSARAIWLNETTSSSRSASEVSSNRVSIWPSAMARAASLTSASGRRVRRLAHAPMAAPDSVVMMPAPVSEMARSRRLLLSSSSGIRS